MDAKKCPVCATTLKGHLSRHMRNVHKWSDERAKKVSLTHDLRKSYDWQGEKPVRTKKATERREENKEDKNEKKTKADYHRKKWCPVPGCLTITKKLSAHLKGGMHKMDTGEEYYGMLKQARTFIPFNGAERKVFRESLRREDERRSLVVQAVATSNPECVENENENDMRIDQNLTVDVDVNSVLSKFLVYLMSPDGGKRERKSSLQTVQEVRTILSVLDGRLENLLDRLKVRDSFFRDHLDAKCKPGTSKHYMSSLITFMDFGISESLDIPLCTTEDFTAMKLRLYNWRKLYNKKISEQRWETEEEQQEVLITPEQLAIFQQGEMARKAITLFGFVSEDENFEPSLLQYTIMRDFIMTVIALANAHRSGVSANMTLSEYEKAKIDEKSDTALIHVFKHKTLCKHGPAVVCISIQTYNFLKIFVTKVRSKIGSDAPNVFVSWSGSAMESGAVSRQINSIWVRSGVYGDNAPPKKNICTTVIRKSVTTLVHDKFEHNAQPVADLLAHDLQTAKKIYRVKNREKQAVSGSRAIAQAWQLPSMAETHGDYAVPYDPILLRQAWKPKEEEQLREIFSDIIKSKAVTMNDVKEGISETDFGKTHKQVYDKLRALINISIKSDDTTITLPMEKETLAERVGRIDEIGEMNSEIISVAGGLDQDDNMSVISQTESSSTLSGKQKLFNNEHCVELMSLCKHIAVSGPISVGRIQAALGQTSLGTSILNSYKMYQIQARLKHERRKIRLKC